MNLHDYMQALGRQAREASRAMARASTRQRDAALLALAAAIRRERDTLLAANREDVAAARQAGLEAALLDRLRLDEKSVATMAEGLEQIAALADPIGEITDLRYRPSGIQVGHMRVPLGVIGIIYEARPNVTVDAAGLCLKSGNAAILRGGSEAIRCNQALARLVHEGLTQAGLPATAAQIVETTDRAAVGELVRLEGLVDVIVPRGGKGLIERIAREARIPVIKHLDGNCHVYVDSAADADKALAIVVNAKTQRLGTCNTAESLLIAQDIAPALLPRLGQALAERGVTLRGCPQSLAILRDAGIAPQRLAAASEADWSEEYLDAILAVKVVADVSEAIEHINRYSSQHTEAIVTENHSHAMRFLREVDSSSVMVNASTRFADGFEYGLGAEIGISTDKLHARGPVGLEGLTSQKWVVLGHGEIRQ